MAAAVGIDLCYDYTYVHRSGREDVLQIPTVICRDRETERFYIGEEAYRKALAGDGMIVDKLLELCERGGCATLCGACCEAPELLAHFLKEALLSAFEPAGTLPQGLSLTVTLDACEGPLYQAVQAALLSLGLSPGNVFVTDRTEAMIYYILGGDKELYHRAAALFCLREDGLFYYEMQVIRGVERMSAAGDYVKLPELFNADLLKTDVGRKLADEILLGTAQKLMARHSYSSVFLTGRGFRKPEYFPGLTGFLCRGRRVLLETGLFARGACMEAEDRLRETSGYPYLFLCASRIPSDISVRVSNQKREERFILAEAGEAWEGKTTSLRFLPAGQDYVDLEIAPANRKEQKRSLRLSLADFPKRPDRCTVVELTAAFPGPGKMRICLRDLGFGEIFPKSDLCVTEEADIR